MLNAPGSSFTEAYECLRELARIEGSLEIDCFRASISKVMLVSRGRDESMLMGKICCDSDAGTQLVG